MLGSAVLEQLTMEGRVALDFSGEWILNRQVSSLSEGAAAIESGALWIDHDDPKCRFRINMKAGGESVVRAWEGNVSDRMEVAAGGFWNRLFWDEDALVFDCGSDSPDNRWTMSWRYKLMTDGQRLRAVEQMRGDGRNFENIWVFERSHTG